MPTQPFYTCFSPQINYVKAKIKLYDYREETKNNITECDEKPAVKTLGNSQGVKYE